MTRRIRLAAAVVTVAMGIWAAAPASAQRTQSAPPGDSALALRFSELGRDVLRTKYLIDPSWQASASLMQAANRLDPGNLRYARLWFDAELQAHNRDGAIAAAKAILVASPRNINAQTELVDLYLSKQESADAKLAYLNAIVGKPPVGDLVRSHAAARAAQVLLDRSETDQAKSMLAESLHLNPLNMDALRLRFQLAQTSGTPLEQTTAELALLRANPAQPQVMAVLARQLADQGLAGPSLQWYVLAGNLGVRMNVPPPPGFLTGYASELFIAGQTDQANKLLDQVLANSPANADLWFLRLTIDKSTKAASFDQDKRRAGVALSNRLAEVRTAAGQKGATTRPVDSGAGLDIPDLAGDLNLVKAMATNQARDAYVSALGDIAWYQIYYLEQPASPAILDFLHQVLPPDSLLLARLDGWNALVQNKNDDARIKLSAIASRDPLAQLGMLRLNGNGQKTDSAARKLVTDNPAGLLGAILSGALRSDSVKIIPSNQADAIKAEVDRFPSDLLNILDKPQDFYAVRGEPTQIAHSFGEPLLLEVTIQNLSDYDLTIGPDGVIRADLWFDARLRGAIDKQVPGVAYDVIADSGVLKARQGITQVVRIDQGDLGQFLSTNPSVSVQVYVGIMTNPQGTREGGLSAGPAGYRVQVPRVMEREASPIGSDPQRQRFYNLLSTGNGAEKIRSLELLATYVHVVRADKNLPKEALQIAGQMADAVRSGMTDSAVSVQAWASYLSALIAPPEQTAGLVKTMLEDKAWEKRMLGVAALSSLSPDQLKALPAHPGAADQDAVVQRFAKAQAELMARAATQPSLQPGSAATPGAAAPAPQPATRP